MANEMLVRAWKDEEYRESLGEAERALLPENPAGCLELTDAELDRVAGGGGGSNFCFLSVLFCGLSFICGAVSACGFSAIVIRGGGIIIGPGNDV